jgi:NAD(P)-dependent dehydrogenase (short-subunit alcohol dehydrogenase family)
MLEGKAIVITGAGRGIGRATAMSAARQGARVVVNDIAGEEADTVVKLITEAGGDAVASHHSVTDAGQARALIDLCVTRFGRIDALLNNAGVTKISDPWDVTPSDIDLLVDINVKGLVHCGVAALRRMRDQRSGTVVNVTSRTHIGDHDLALYAATKGAAASVTYGWAIDMAPYGVRVSAFSPLAQTRMSRAGGRADPADVAEGAIYLLSDRAKELSGQVLRFDGRKLSLMRLPVYDDPVIERQRYTSEDIADILDHELHPYICPVGMAGADLRRLDIH